MEVLLLIYTIHPNSRAFSFAASQARDMNSCVPTGGFFATMYGLPRGLK